MRSQEGKGETNKIVILHNSLPYWCILTAEFYLGNAIISAISFK